MAVPWGEHPKPAVPFPANSGNSNTIHNRSILQNSKTRLPARFHRRSDGRETLVLAVSDLAGSSQRYVQGSDYVYWLTIGK
jgi:hypothetical protein